MAFPVIAVMVGIALIQAGISYYQSRKANDEIEEPDRQDPTLPRVTESDPLPVVWGTVRVRGANVVWWGNQRQVGVEKERQAIQAHLGICQGPIDEVAAVYIGEERGITLEDDGMTSTVINSWDVSGGIVSQEGKVIRVYETVTLSGSYRVDKSHLSSTYFMPGLPAQVAPASMTGGSGLDENLPGYRGAFTVWTNLAWSPEHTNRIDPVSFKVRRRFVRSFNNSQWQPTLAAPNDDDLNPAHIIREILVDQQWGAALPLDRIDETTFAAAAQTLFDEEFGLSGIWGRVEKYGAKINEILSHINGVSYEERTTGKIVLKLIRDDYDAAAIPLITAEHVNSIRRTRPQPWELVNQLTVKYSSRDVDRLRTVPANDTAAQSVRGIVADSVTYSMIYDGDLAAKVATRDLRTLGNPLTNVRLSLVPSVSQDLRPGDVFVLNHPDEGVNQMVIRVVDTLEPQDNSTDASIVIEGVEDAFAFADGISTPPVDIDITPQNISPLPADDQVAFELPYWLAVQWSWDVGIWDDGLDESDRSRMALAAYSETESQIDFSVHSDGTVRESGASFGQRVDVAPSTTGFNFETDAAAAFLFDDESTLPDTKLLIYIDDENLQNVDGSPNPAFAYIDTDTGEFSLGLFDTTPPIKIGQLASGWVVGAMDFKSTGEPEVARIYGVDPTLHADAESVDLKALTRTLLGSLDSEQAPTSTVTADQRTLRPYPPGKIRVGGRSDKPATADGFLVITWASRWRLGDQVEQDDLSVATPTDHDVVVTIYASDGTTFTELRTGTVPMADETLNYSNSDEEADRIAAGLPSTLGDLVFEVEGKRDGLLSFSANTRFYDRA